MYNASFWRRYFQSMFIPHLERTLQVLEHRLLPTFDGIEAEATALQEKTYSELMSMPLDPDLDAVAKLSFGSVNFSGLVLTFCLVLPDRKRCLKN